MTPTVNNRGMTLIEILITLAIIAGVVVFTVSTLGGGSAARQVRVASQDIVRTIRVVYDTTLVKGLCYRIVFDLDAQKIFVEYSENPFAVKQETEESLKEKNNTNDEETNQDEESDIGADLNLLDSEKKKEEEKNTILPPQAADFVSVEDDLMEPFDLPQKVRVVDVFVQHQFDKIDQGMAYLHFFPKGYTEYAIIHVGDVDGEKYFTLVVNPLTGAVDVREGYLEKEEIEEENP